MNNDMFNIQKRIKEMFNPIIEARKSFVNDLNQKVMQSTEHFTDILRKSLKDTGILDLINTLPRPKREIINHLIKCGWAIPHHMFIDFAGDEDVLSYTQEELDQTFVSMYLDNDKELYFETKKFILDEISPRFKEIMNTCFNHYEENQISITIPTLLTIIEGEMSQVSGLEDSWKFTQKVRKAYGYKEKKIEDINESDEIRDISVYSLVYYLNDVLFKTIDFTNVKPASLNRNKVLHGWDNPEDWNEVDFIRLIHTILTIEMIKV